MAKKLFEVFLGTYNAESWIENVILSLESQDSEPFSVKIIDNASTDKTIDILEELFSKHKFHNEYTLIKNSINIGAIGTFFDQLEVFDSEWLIMIHQDDYYHPNHISTLVEEIQRSHKDTACIFTAMKRMDAQGKEIFIHPSIASKLSETNKLDNFLLCLQIQPINFPAVALRISTLQKITTTKHTTAFNDTELLLRLICVAGVRYVPKETMHYRIYSGNASGNTSNEANDRAVFIGLNEVFHSNEIEEIFKKVDNDEKCKKFVKSLENALDIRITSEPTKNLLRNLIAETLIRRFGYKNKIFASLLISSLHKLGMVKESNTVENLNAFNGNTFSRLDFLGTENFKTKESKILVKADRLARLKSFSFIPLRFREKLFDQFFKRNIFKISKNLFLKAWRISSNK